MGGKLCLPIYYHHGSVFHLRLYWLRILYVVGFWSNVVHYRDCCLGHTPWLSLCLSFTVYDETKKDNCMREELIARTMLCPHSQAFLIRRELKHILWTHNWSYELSVWSKTTLLTEHRILELAQYTLSMPMWWTGSLWGHVKNPDNPCFLYRATVNTPNKNINSTCKVLVRCFMSWN